MKISKGLEDVISKAVKDAMYTLGRYDQLINRFQNEPDREYVHKVLVNSNFPTLLVLGSRHAYIEDAVLSAIKRYRTKSK